MQIHFDGDLQICGRTYSCLLMLCAVKVASDAVSFSEYAIQHKSPTWTVKEKAYRLVKRTIDLSTYCGRDKMADILKTTLSNAFYWPKMFQLWLNFHWTMFLKFQLTINQHWFRQWLGAEQATSHYLKQRWPSLLTYICVTLPEWVEQSCSIFFRKLRYIFAFCRIFKHWGSTSSSSLWKKGDRAWQKQKYCLLISAYSGFSTRKVII